MIARPTYISWILMTIFCVNDFPTIFLLTGGGPVNSTQTLVVLAYRTVFQNFQIGPGVAIAFLMTIVLVAVIGSLYRQVRKATNRMSAHTPALARRMRSSPRQTGAARPAAGWRFTALAVIAVVVLVPLVAVVALSRCSHRSGAQPRGRPSRTTSRSSPRQASPPGSATASS